MGVKEGVGPGVGSTSTVGVGGGGGMGVSAPERHPASQPAAAVVDSLRKVRRETDRRRLVPFGCLVVNMFFSA